MSYDRAQAYYLGAEYDGAILATLERIPTGRAELGAPQPLALELLSRAQARASEAGLAVQPVSLGAYRGVSIVPGVDLRSPEMLENDDRDPRDVDIEFALGTHHVLRIKGLISNWDMFRLLKAHRAGDSLTGR